jgi:hypothetical protein
MTRRFWLSFADPGRKRGHQFLGVAIVEVTEEDAALAKAEVDTKFPQHQPGAEWIAAATRKAWLTDCNPGGEVACVDVTDRPLDDSVPLHTFMRKPELMRRGLIE